MDNLRTVIGVLVVLFAFTCFQLIANYSLRRSVSADVRGQIDQIDKRLQRTTQLMDRFEQSLKTLNRQTTDAAAKSAALTESIGTLGQSVRALKDDIGDLKTELETIKTNLANSKRDEP